MSFSNAIRSADDVTLGDEIARVAAQLDAATHHLLTCIRRFDYSGGWHQQGALSCAHWLSWRIGLDLGTAREKVRVARALGQLPCIDGALGNGALSYAKVRAMTRVATPENEGRLLELALASTGAQLERLCRRFRRVVAVEQGERLDERRYVRDDVLPSGLVRISAVLQPDEAALVMKAIEAARRASAAVESSAEMPTAPPEATQFLPMADALVKVAESFLADGERAGNGGERTQIVIYLDQDVLAGDGCLAAMLDDGTRISAETFRRVACDCGVVPVVQDEGGRTANAGRRTRTVPPAVRRALWTRDRGCRFPGCTNRLYVHAHHVEHWAHGGATSVDNLLLLCSAHHRLVHEGGFGLELVDDEAVFRDPRGRVIDGHPVAEVTDTWPPLVTVDDSDLEIREDANFPGWDGSPLDYGSAVAALLG